ncbi:hypothetical protein DT351_09885 [Latilactobacillus curvatus]|uniref:Uncharacterized protein n=1 Tax=Latilactobacillus curvatus TaxID=28038 RepID=A0A385AG51_LATCU|nr:hypothetical protein DT351_09885 [Latilactobacillus curvatus]
MTCSGAMCPHHEPASQGAGFPLCSSHIGFSLRFSETMKQLDSGLISKKLSINSSTLLTQIAPMSINGTSFSKHSF